MKRFLLCAALALAACFTGCATAQTAATAGATVTATASNPLDPSKIVADLQNAQEISTAAGATQDAACYGAQAAWVQSIAASVPASATANLPAATGIAGNFELARLKVKQVKNFDAAIKQALVAGPPQTVHDACAPMWLEIQGDGARVAALLGIANATLAPGVGAAALGLAGAINATLPIPLK